jgi:hypothetical protein
VIDESLDGETVWAVVRTDRTGLRRLTDRRIVQSDVVAPDGRRYRVAICRNLPWHDSSLLSADDLALSALSAAALVARVVAARGRFGWTIMVSAPETTWRASRTVYRERSRDADVVANRALDLARAIQQGERPWTLRG